MDNIYSYLISGMPPGVHEMVRPCADGYTIYIDDRLDYAHRMKHYEHALEHIRRGDFDDYGDVQIIEAEAHNEIKAKEIEVKEKKSSIKEPKVKKKAKKRNYIAQKVKFMEAAGIDFFAAAETRWLEP